MVSGLTEQINGRLRASYLPGEVPPLLSYDAATIDEWQTEINRRARDGEWLSAWYRQNQPEHPAYDPKEIERQRQEQQERQEAAELLTALARVARYYPRELTAIANVGGRGAA